jgi:hypothetical protein
MIISFQQWREGRIDEQPEAGGTANAPASGFQVARTTGQARKEFKTMDPRMLQFGANLAHAFGEIEAEKAGYTKRIITVLANGLNRFTEIPQDEINLLKRKLIMAAQHLPSQPMAQQPQQSDAARKGMYDYDVSQ